MQLFCIKSFFEVFNKMPQYTSKSRIQRGDFFFRMFLESHREVAYYNVDTTFAKTLSNVSFFYIHLGYSLYFTVVCLCHITRGIPPPRSGIVGKNRSTRSKTTVRNKRVGPLGSKWGPFTWFPQ